MAPKPIFCSTIFLLPRGLQHADVLEAISRRVGRLSDGAPAAVVGAVVDRLGFMPNMNRQPLGICKNCRCKCIVGSGGKVK